MFLIIIFLLAQAYWFELMYGGAFTCHLCKVIRENRTQAYVREFLLKKVLQTRGSVFMQCTAKEAKK